MLNAQCSMPNAQLIMEALYCKMQLIYNNNNNNNNNKEAIAMMIFLLSLYAISFI